MNTTKPVPIVVHISRSSTVAYLDEAAMRSADPTAGPPENSIWRRRECKHALAPFRLGAQNMGTLAWAFTHCSRQGGNADKKGLE